MSQVIANIRSMDHKTWLGNLAEAKVIAALIEQGFDVFRSLSGKASVDLIALKDGQMLRVEVKGTAQETVRGAHVIRIASTRSNRTRNLVRPFDASSSDILAVYIRALDTVCFISSALLHGRSYVNLREHPNRTSNGLISWLVDDLRAVPTFEASANSKLN